MGKGNDDIVCDEGIPGAYLTGKKCWAKRPCGYPPDGTCGHAPPSDSLLIYVPYHLEKHQIISGHRVVYSFFFVDIKRWPGIGALRKRGGP